MSDDIENPIELACDKPVNTTIPVNTLNDREVLDATRSIKFAMVNHLISPGCMPEDPKDINAVMGIINSLDSTAINSIRMNQEASDGAAAQEAIRILAEMTGVLGNSNPYRDDSGGTREVTLETTPLIDTTFVPGETSTEIRDIEYDDFVSDFEDDDV